MISFELNVYTMVCALTATQISGYITTLGVVIKVHT